MDDVPSLSSAACLFPVGYPLLSGFEYRPASEHPLSGDALKRVLEKMDAVDEARLRAAESSRTYVIG